MNKRGKYLHEETLETYWEKEAEKLSEAMGEAGQDASPIIAPLDFLTGVEHQKIRITESFRKSGTCKMDLEFNNSSQAIIQSQGCFYKKEVGQSIEWLACS